jgi:hypothetical protein
MPFSDKIKIQIEKLAASRCMMCKHLTRRPAQHEDASYNLGEAAHIAGESDKRYDASLPLEYVNSIDNALWLCSSCHTKIDRDIATYTVERLNKIKKIT